MSHRLILLAASWFIGSTPGQHAPSAPQRGLKFEWFDGENLETKVGQRIESRISTVFGEGAAGRCGKPDHFSCRWTGFIHAPAPGVYQLRGWADDGFRLSLDGQVVLDAWEKGNDQQAAVKFERKPKALVFEFREAEAYAGACLAWRPPDETRFVIVPPSAYSVTQEPPPRGATHHADGSGLKVSVFRDMELKNEVPCDLFDGGMDDEVDWDFREFAIDPVVGRDKFSIRWKGWVVAPSTGKFTISTWADDGIRVKLDGKILIDGWNGPGTHQSSLFEFDGKPHAIEVEYFERTGTAFVSLHWSKEGELEDEVIPSSALFSTASAANDACKTIGPDKGK